MKGKAKMKTLWNKFKYYIPLITTTIALYPNAVYAREGSRTIRGLTELRHYLESPNGAEFKSAFSSLLNIMRNICILTVAIAFAVVMLSVVIQAGKLGGANILAPEGNTRQRQEAYDGIMHAVIHFGIIGAAGTIFSFLCKFLLGI